ncbi:nickel/cobalt transporter [Tateyamaria omphalii]|uniref:nickel/cobalt transporter n=1 Tax=Tateyamaria omphalii TaxID=299262 RepID=UPI00167665C0|nr:hypothetical protein [Tateyamaria omphalii]
MFQNAMVSALRAIRDGDCLAVFSLCSATAVYGFVHALGPGHGKVLLGGAALASGVTMRRMVVLTLASSLSQSAAAIALVLAAAFVLGWATRDIVGWTETWLAPASALAIAGIGVLLNVRGLRSWNDVRSERNRLLDDACGCGHSHGPTMAQVQNLTSFRDAAAIVLSIAMRPCTGALFLLVIALRLDIFAVGCLAVLTMGLGTASFNLLVASAGIGVRRLTALPLNSQMMQQFSAYVHIGCGTLIAVLSLALARTYLDSSFVFP